MPEDLNPLLDLPPDHPVRVEAMSLLQSMKGVEHNPTLMVLRTHLVTESYLERLILNKVPRGDRLLDRTNLSYSWKLALVDALDVLDDRLIQCLKRLNRLRNRMAHNLDVKPTRTDVENVGQPLGSKLLAEVRKESAGDSHEFLCCVLGSIIGGALAVVTDIEGAQLNAHVRPQRHDAAGGK